MSEPNKSRFHHLKQRLAHLVAPFRTFAQRYSTFGRLQQRHRDLLDRGAKVPPDEIRAYIEEAVAASKEIADPSQRAQLRADLRYWAGVLHARSKNKEYPDVELLPAAGLRRQVLLRILQSILTTVAVSVAVSSIVHNLLPKPSPIPTAQPITRPAATPTWTPSPTPTRRPTHTPTHTPSPTPSRTPTPTPTWTPTPTSGPSPTTPSLLPSPLLLGPEDGTVFGSPDFVELAWQWPDELQPRYVYVIGMRHESEPDMGSLAWTRETTYGAMLPIWQPGVYYWVVGVSELSQDQNTWTRVSLPSETRTFVWLPTEPPESGGSNGGLKPPPPPD